MIGEVTKLIEERCQCFFHLMVGPHLADDEWPVSLDEGTTSSQDTILGPFRVGLDDINSLELLVRSPFIERRDGNPYGAAGALDKAGGVMSIGGQEEE
ncbi:MAG TPA: hypothetical protein VFY54_02530 [Rubrobacter sp.]|nr:hypothetical protein [Rubrobacter sp.]